MSLHHPRTPRGVCPGGLVHSSHEVGHLHPGGADKLSTIVVEKAVRTSVDRDPGLQHCLDDVLGLLGLDHPGGHQLRPDVDDVENDETVPLDPEVDPNYLIEAVCYRNTCDWLAGCVLLHLTAQTVLGDVVQFFIHQLLVPLSGPLLEEIPHLGLAGMTGLLVELPDVLPLLLV